MLVIISMSLGTLLWLHQTHLVHVATTDSTVKGVHTCVGFLR